MKCRLQLSEFVPAAELAWIAAVLLTQGCRGSNGLAAGATGGHDPGRSEGDVGGTDDAPGQEEVADVLAVVTAVRNAVGALRVPLGAAGFSE